MRISRARTYGFEPNNMLDFHSLLNLSENKDIKMQTNEMENSGRLQ